MKHPVRPLPVTLALASVCLVFCQCSLGSRPASFPQWQQVSTGITAESDVILVAISPHDPQTMHMGTYDPGGLYCSFDAGLSWQRCNEGLETLTVLSLAYNPRERSALLAGTVSGPYASADGGKTWAPVAALSARYIYALAWAPKDSAVYAGTPATKPSTGRPPGQGEAISAQTTMVDVVPRRTLCAARSSFSSPFPTSNR